MAFRLRSALLIVFLLGMWAGSAHAKRGDEEVKCSSFKNDVKRLREELSRIREALEKAQRDLAQLHSLYGMDRYRFPGSIELFGETIPLQRRDVWERMDREFLLAVHDVPQVLLWIKRSNRYFPFIQDMLRRRMLPDDLKYIAIVESGLRPKARSWAGAVGLWQFISSTGVKYDLRKTDWVDERRDPVESTEAALSYLEDLHEIFGDWFLAVAAYNVGEDRIKKGLKRQRVISYFDLLLPRETERYIFRIATAKVILSDRETYGFELDPSELYEPLKVERADVYVKGRQLSLLSLAKASGMTLRSFMSLNPHFRKSSIPEGQYKIYIPHEKKEDTLSFIKLRNQSQAYSNKIVHRVKSGETLFKIAQKYGVCVRTMREWNHLKDVNLIHPGQHLTIYR